MLTRHDPLIVTRRPLRPTKVRTDSLDEFLGVLNTLHDGARVPLRYLLPYSQHQERLAVITIERTWFACAKYDLDPTSGCWLASKPPPPPPPPLLGPRSVSFTLAGPPEVQVTRPKRTPVTMLP